GATTRGICASALPRSNGVSYSLPLTLPHASCTVPGADLRIRTAMNSRTAALAAAAAALTLSTLPDPAAAQPRPALRETEAVPPPAALTSATSSRFRDAVDRYGTDRAALNR